MTYPLGKLPASPLNTKKAIMFNEVFDTTKMPTPPMAFGQQKLIKNWFVYGNDEYGDCVWASKAHMHMLWPLMGGYPRNRFTANDVLSDYAACTGFSASDPNSDQGTDMKSAAEYHRKTGIRDSKGNRHRVHAYVNMTPGNLQQLAVATYVFGAVELGVLVTNDNMDQFDAGKPWTITGADPIGGHCVPVVGRDNDGNFLCVTWGRLQRIAPTFIQKYMDEGITFLDKEIINKAGLTIGAFKLDMLEKMLSKVSPQPVMRTLEEIAQAEQDDSEHIRYGIASVPDAYPTDEQFDAAFNILRAALDKSGYGWALNDEKLRPYSDAVAVGVVRATPKESPS